MMDAHLKLACLQSANEKIKNVGLPLKYHYFSQVQACAKFFQCAWQ